MASYLSFLESINTKKIGALSFDGNVPFFWAAKPKGPITAKVGQKCVYQTDGFMPSAHPFYWRKDAMKKSIKGKVKQTITWKTVGTHKLKVREGCPFFGESAHSAWSPELTVVVSE